ncbi:F-box protein At1g53790-like [Cornus florida]|uniref:F-box protein At1g53790-like n=1 Tax=Cornus florida TaxID=4283 RepID=UPI0028980C5C|nr:F-box protein At1g53790-like [Cornus florida]
MYVYTLKTNSWRRIQDIPLGIHLPLKASGILLHGVLHWLNAYDCEIICFDLVEEKFRFLRLHPGLIGDDPLDTRYSTLEVLRGCLCISCLKWEPNCLPCREFWVMKEYFKNDWSSMTCDSNKSLDDFSNSDKEDLFSFEKRWLVGYNVEKDSYCRYHVFDCNSDTMWELEIYLETIVSPYHVP